jgi:hypothetical protein
MVDLVFPQAPILQDLLVVLVGEPPLILELQVDQQHNHHNQVHLEPMVEVLLVDLIVLLVLVMLLLAEVVLAVLVLDLVAVFRVEEVEVLDMLFLFLDHQ